MVASLDGFIAKHDGTVDWLETQDEFADGVTGEDADESMQVIDCFVMGSRTYETALKLGWPYGLVPTFVLTHRDFISNRSNVEFHDGDLPEFVDGNLKKRFSNIWVVGGAMLTKEFIRLDLADEIILAVVPVLIGDGMLFFDFVGVERSLHLKDVTAYKSGMVELRYEIKK